MVFFPSLSQKTEVVEGDLTFSAEKPVDNGMAQTDYVTRNQNKLTTGPIGYSNALLHG
jgi:hypothetical protein